MRRRVGRCTDILLQAGGMREQGPKGEELGLRWTGRDPEPGKDLVDGTVQVEKALVDQSHRGNAREQLGYGADAVDCLRCRRPSGLDVRESESLRPDQGLVVYHRHRYAGELLVGLLRVNPAVEQIDRVADPGVTTYVLCPELASRKLRRAQGEHDDRGQLSVQLPHDSPSPGSLRPVPQQRLWFTPGLRRAHHPTAGVEYP